MSFLSNLLKGLSAIQKYGALAQQAVAQVQSEVGASNADPAIQSSKKQLAIMYVLAGAHAGENVSNATVQTIAGVVDFVASTAKALGLFGKVATPAASVPVPPATPAA